MQNKVTAVIISHRTEWRFIERAIISVENQLYPAHEILIIDDNDPMTVYSQDIKECLCDHPDVKLISNGDHRGLSYCRNLAIAKAEGDFISFLRDTDEWRPKKLKIQMEMLEQHPDAGLLFGAGKEVRQNELYDTLTWTGINFNSNPSLSDMMKTDYVGSASQALILMDALRKVGGFIDTDQSEIMDYEMWIRIAQRYPIYGTNRILYVNYIYNEQNGYHVQMLNGYKTIYHAYKRLYDEDRSAKERIFYRMLQQSIMARSPEVITLGTQWFFTLFGKEKEKERERALDGFYFI